MAANPFSDPEFGADAAKGAKPASKKNPFSDPEFGKEPKRTWGEAAKDTGAAVMGGLAGLVKTGGDLYGLASGNMDNAASELGRNAQEYWSDAKSQALQTKIAQRKANIDAQESTLGKAWTAVKDTLTDPALAADTVAENVATMLPGAGVGRAVGAAKYARGFQAASEFGPASLAAREAIAKQAGKYATGAAIGTGAVQQGADVSGDIYGDLMKKTDAEWDASPDFQAALQRHGGDRQAAKSELANATARAAFLPTAGISVAANAIPGATYLERALVGAPLRTGAKEVGRFGAARGFARGVLGEGGQEFVEEGGGRLGANLAAQQQAMPGHDTWDGVGENAGMGFAGGALLGVGGGVHGAREAMAQKRAQDAAKGAEDGGTLGTPAADTPPADVPPGDGQAGPGGGLGAPTGAGADMAGMLAPANPLLEAMNQRAADPSAIAPPIDDGKIFDKSAAAPVAGELYQPGDTTNPLTGERITAKPSEAMGLNPATGPLSAGAAVAVDTGVAGGLQQAAAQAQADQQAQASQRTDFPMLEYAGLSDDDRAAYDSYFNSVSEQTDDHLAAAISDGDIPDFGDESNVSEVEFLRRMGASEQEILDAIEAASTAGGPQAGARGAAETQTDVADSARPFAGADSQPGTGQESAQALTAAERAALQADLDAEQEGSVPGARGADRAFASVTEDAGALPAEPTKVSTTTKGTTDGTQAQETQQAGQGQQEARAGQAGARDESHLNALELRLSHERGRLRAAQTDAERTARQVTVDGIEREIAGERKFLGLAPQAASAMSDDALMQALKPDGAEKTSTAQPPLSGTISPQPQAAGPAIAAPEFTTIKTVHGDSVTVRTSDLQGDAPRLRQYTKAGKAKAVPAIHRDNLDLTGEKSAERAKENAKNPLFHTVTTKDGGAFASQAAAQREVNRLGLQDSHEVVEAGGGFVGRIKKTGEQHGATARNLRLADERTPGAGAAAPHGPGESVAGEAPVVGAGQRQQAQAAAGNAAKPANLFSDPRTGAPVVVQNKATADAMARSKQLSGKVAVRKATPAEMADERNAFTGYNAGENRRIGYVLEMLPPKDAPATHAVTDRDNAQDKADAFIKTLTSKDGDASAPVAEPPAPAGRTYLAVPFNEKDYAKRAGAKWDEGKKLWYADPVGGDGAAAGEININLKQYVPQDSTKDDRYNYYGDKALATAVALNASARDGVQYDTIKRKHPDGIMMWSVVKAGEQTQAESAEKTSAATENVAQTITAADVQADTPKLTQSEAKELMEWQDLGQKDGVKTHALTFYESQADKDAKRGRMIVAKVTKGDRSASNWMVDGDDKPLAVLGMAKKRAEDAGMAKLVADGFVAQEGNTAPEGTQFPMQEAVSSYAGISHRGQERAQSDADEFERFISAQQEAGLAVAETEDQKAAVARAVEALRADYVTAYRRLMGVRANTYSAYVAGRSGLNSRQANRSNSALDKAMEAFSEWQTAASGRVRRAALDARTDDQKQADQQAREQTEADKAQRREDADRSLIRKILTWKKGGEAVPIGKSATLSGVNLGRDGYPTSVNLKPNDGATLTSDKFDLAALFRRDGMSVPDSRRRVRELVDAVRAEDAAQTSGQDAAPASAPTSDSKTPMMDGHVDLLDRVREGKATADQIRESFARMDAGRDALEAELNTMSKDKLLRSGGYSFAMRHRDSKKAEVVSAMVDEVLDEYSLGRSYGPTGYVLSAGAFERHKQARAADLRELVAGLTDEDIAQFARQVAESRAELQARREATQQALENPQTLADFRAVISSHMEKHGDSMRDAYLRLTPEQRARYDDLEAEGTKARREQAKAAAKAAVAAAGQATVGEVIATRHTKLGHDLFVVQLAERVSREDYDTLNASARRIGGNYSSYRGNGAIPGFQFRTREAAEAFSKLVAGDEADAQAVAQARRDAFEDDRSQSAVERLRAMAAALNERADEQLGRERKTNTARRARFAASAEGAALADKALAGTMNNLAAAIEAGTTKFLDAVRQKVQVEMLGQYLRSAKDAQIRAKYPSYGDQQKHRGEPVDAETVDYAEFPTYVAMRSDLASIARQMLEVDGLKQLGQRLMSVADDVSEAYTAWAKDNLLSVSRFGRGDQLADFVSRDGAERAMRRAGLADRAIVLPIKRGQNRVVLAPSEAMKLGLWQGDGDKRITLSSDFGRELVQAVGRRAGGQIKLPWTLEAALERRKRLEGMGIFTAPEFRSALREFAGLQQAIATPDKIKEMERAMIGRANDGLDFFPTSPDVVQSMLDAAEIQDGMAVLEPSAGMGHIADAIRKTAGVDPDVVELSGARRELLEAKGYNLVGNDFMAMTPRSGFTFGDVFRDANGDLGVMRGSGSMGSGRVGFQPLDASRQPDARNARWVNRDELTGVEHRGADSGYDRIIMNPPFSDGRDIQHVQHAYELLRPGGRIVAIMGEGAFFQSNKRAEAFREWLEERGATSEKLPEGSFMDPSLPVNTSVNARMVVIDKPVAAQEGDANFGARQRAASGTPTDRAVMDMTRDGKSAQDILRLIAGTSKSRFNRQVARLLLRTGVTPKVEALAADGLGKDKRGFNLLAKYSRDSNTISLTEGAGYMAEQIMLHELIHAATLRALDRKGLASLQMRRLFEHVQKHGGLDGTYGMKNVGEFVSEAFTNPDFQRELRKIKGMQDGGAIKTAWDGFVRILRSILGLPQSEHSALSQALELGVAVMREDMALRQRGVVARGRDAQAGIDQTQTEAFKRWFKDSKVVDADGKPLVVMHASTYGDISEFKKEAQRFGKAGFGFYFSDASGSNLFAEYGDRFQMERSASGEQKAVKTYPVYLSLQNPLVVDHVDDLARHLDRGQKFGVARGLFGNLPADAMLWLQRQGYDGIITRETTAPRVHKTRGLKILDRNDPKAVSFPVYVAFEPAQIKSAIGNNGNFDPEDADIAHFGAAELRGLKDNALDRINTVMSHPGKVSLWDKTVGTMRNLAERAPAFKPVFEAAQRFIDDVALLANDAADMAPRVLPRVDTWRDLAKKPISAADNKAVAKPLFEGTLLWARDANDKPVLVSDLEKRYANLPAEDKAQMMLKLGKLDAGVLRMWQGLPLEQFEALVESRFESQMLKAGVVWTDKELADIFKATPHQIGLYRETRKAIDRSIDMTARADMLRVLGEDFGGLRDAVLEQDSLGDAMEFLISELTERQRANPDDSRRLTELHNSIVDRAERARDLMDKGYAPLSRFGRYTVDVVDASGERQYFGMYESKADSNRALMQLKAAFPGATVTQGTMSQEAYKLFAGITPESLELFGNMLGLDEEGGDARDKVFQEYLKLTKNNHSALKRLIHRQGIAGFSEDVGRVLAAFVYSNARQSAGALNAGTIDKAVNAIPKEQGELKDVAMGLRNYIRDPQEEGQAVRGMLFAQYLGGSVASAFVNMTQPFAITMPWLSQYGGIKSAGAHLAKALKDMGTKGFKYEADLAAALKHAEDDGVVSPQEIHQLMAQARGSGSLRSGDGTRVGEARAAAANAWERTKVAWGQPFALAEQFNRRSTFIAAYRIAKEQKMADPAAFARRAVEETQFVYSKAAKSRWMRGAIGGTLMTFKSYSIQYLELLHRMWTQGGPQGKRAVGWAMVMLMLAGGAGGLPFMEDLEDLIDGIAQLMGYNVSSKQWRQRAMRDVLGKELAEFMEQGVSGLPGAPVDVSGRLGLGNLIPGTGLLLQKPNRERDLLEVAGPAGDLFKRGFTGGRKLLAGDVGGAALEVSPTAVSNAVKGADMAASGMYKDAKGYKVIDTTLGEALAKAGGFQPRSVAQVQEANSFMMRSRSFYQQNSAEIKAQWADALFRKDEAALERVRERLAAWNRDNPEQPIVVKMPDVWKRVREMGKDRTQRIADTAPKALRQQMREMARENG